MQKLNLPVFTILLLALTGGCAPMAGVQRQEVKAPDRNSPPADCPVTIRGSSSFEPPASFSLNLPLPSQFWFCSTDLWTSLPTDGIWAELPKNPDGYTQKIFWWSDSFSIADEPEPVLVVFGERLDADAPPLKTYGATNASAADIGEAMLTGVDFPTEGCWEVTGQYKKISLSFYVWITP